MKTINIILFLVIVLFLMGISILSIHSDHVASGITFVCALVVIGMLLVGLNGKGEK